MSVVDLGKVIGPQGPAGPQGPQGVQGPKGERSEELTSELQSLRRGA